MMSEIETSAEYAEDNAMPKVGVAPADPKKSPGKPTVPKSPSKAKSPAEWAYERLILYIQNFESQLDKTQEVAMGFTGSDAGIIRIEGLGFFDPDIVTFYGTDQNGARTQLVQHVSQLNVLLRAIPIRSQEPPRRIGFNLASALQKPATPKKRPPRKA
jgi:hypothetical protein